MNREIEEKIGIGVFLTQTRGLGGTLKKYPDDFIVSERSDHQLRSPDGKYSIANVKVRNWETNRLIDHLSNILHISRKKIGFAGTKDKRAVSSQLMSFPVEPSRLENISIKDVYIEKIFRAKRSLTLGDLVGNSFEILIRNTRVAGSEARDIIEKNLQFIDDTGGFLNFFGIQRFGSIRPITHLVGKYIVKGDLEKAVMTYVANPLPGEPRNSFEVRRELEENRDWRDILEKYPPNYSFERAMIRHLGRQNEDYAGAIKSIPKNLQMMFVHAYQSYFFNRMLTERIKRNILPNEVQVGDIVFPVDEYGGPNRRRPIPVNNYNRSKVQGQIDRRRAYITAVLPGTDVELARGEQGEIEQMVMVEEGIKPSDFFIPDIQRLSSKGMRREILARVENVNYTIDEDNIKMSFDLFKGCYATTFLREFMKSDTITNYG